jgi:hypothetical protein
LVYSAFNPDSILEQRLAQLGDELFPWVMKLAADDRGPSRRETAISLARQMALQASVVQLPTRDVAALKTMIRRGLEDEDIVVRRTAVKAVGAWRMVEALPLLEVLEHHDPDGHPSYSVRALARDARRQLAMGR